MFNNLKIDLARILRRRFCESPKRTILELAIMPSLVAGVIVFAFILRYTPSHHREALVFFATLYAFWCGLFGSCQAINSEVVSGEWSYWVLGMRRNVGTHLWAHIISATIIALIQVTACLTVICIINWICGNLVFENLRISYLNKDVLFGGVLQAYDSFYGLTDSRLPCHIGPTILYFAMVIALISGCGMGVFVSCACKEPITSLNISVAIIVVLAILSHTTLHDPKADQKNTGSFAPVYLDIRYLKESHNSGNETEQEKSAVKYFDMGQRLDAKFLEKIAYILPQRYFFNIGRVSFATKSYLDLSGVDCPRRDSSKRPKNYKGNVQACYCFKCLGFSNAEGQWAEWFLTDKSEETFNTSSPWRESIAEILKDAPPYEVFAEEESGDYDDVVAFHKMYGNPHKTNLWGVNSLLTLFLKTLAIESAMAIAQSAFYCFLAFLTIKTNERYYALR